MKKLGTITYLVYSFLYAQMTNLSPRKQKMVLIGPQRKLLNTYWMTCDHKEFIKPEGDKVKHLVFSHILLTLSAKGHKAITPFLLKHHLKKLLIPKYWFCLYTVDSSLLVLLKYHNLKKSYYSSIYLELQLFGISIFKNSG